jgi:Tfp pilus assembly PilM family ATPase
MQAGSKPEPAIIVDIGSVTTDIAVFDKNLLVASAVPGGGDAITELIRTGLRLSPQKATELKKEYGMSYSERQQRIIDAIKPSLENLVREIQKSVRYYSERAAKTDSQISQLITLGGGSGMPGLSQYLSKQLRLETQALDPWQSVDFGQLAVPKPNELTIYITALGSAILDPAEVLA